MNVWSFVATGLEKIENRKITWPKSCQGISGNAANRQELFFTISNAFSMEFVALQKGRTADSDHVCVASLFASFCTGY